MLPGEYFIPVKAGLLRLRDGVGEAEESKLFGRTIDRDRDFGVFP
jgi:hypothetical protein